MFQLVQRGMPLTPAEKLRAMSTNWATFGKKYEADYPRVINRKPSLASLYRLSIILLTNNISLRPEKSLWIPRYYWHLCPADGSHVSNSWIRTSEEPRRHLA